MVGILLNIRGPLESCRWTKRIRISAARTTQTAAQQSNENEQTRRRVSTISNMSELSPNPEWLVGAGTRGPSLERSSLTRKFQTHSWSLGICESTRQVSHKSDVWEGLALGSMGCKHLTTDTNTLKSEDQAIISRSRSQVITPTFFVALLTINGKIKEKEKLYQQVVKTFRDYQHQVVIPSIRNHSNLFRSLYVVFSSVVFERGFWARSARILIVSLSYFITRTSIACITFINWTPHRTPHSNNRYEDGIPQNFAEYMRRIFIDLDKNTDGQCRESISR